MDAHSQLKSLLKELRVGDINRVLKSPLTKIEGNEVIWLDLGCTGVNNIDFRIFTQFERIEYIGLYGNGIVSLPETPFQELKELKYLDLGENRLKSLPEHFFDRENKLLGLWLYGNHFAELSANSFRHLNNLRELNLNAAIIGKMNWEIFAHMPNLERLEIAMNGIKDVPIEVLPNSLKHVIIERLLPSGGISVIDIKQQMETVEVPVSSKDIFCLVTGLMGSGKSTILKQCPYTKYQGYPPKSDVKIFFDQIFALKKPDGASAIFFELDGPTILSWDQFIPTADCIIQVARAQDLQNKDLKNLLRHINLKRNGNSVFILAVTFFPNEQGFERITKELEGFDIDKIIPIPPGEIRPDVGGNRKIILDKKAIGTLYDEVLSIEK